MALVFLSSLRNQATTVIGSRSVYLRIQNSRTLPPSLPLSLTPSHPSFASVPLLHPLKTPPLPIFGTFSPLRLPTSNCPPMQLSGLQLDVLSLYRLVLRTGRSKGSQVYARDTFRADAASVKRMDFKKVEYMLRKGHKHVKLMAMPGVTVVRGTKGSGVAGGGGGL